MQRTSELLELRAICDEQRTHGKRVGLVPTMGFLHEGHLSLVRLARERVDFVVVTIFVNPTQFGEGEDLDRYPSDLPGDLEKLEAVGAQLVFTPLLEAIYPEGFASYVIVEGLTEGLCGASRAGHFRGVCTVVAKLFNMVGPCVAIFGEKDYQQLQVIRRMALDLDMPVEVVGGAIVREPDGLAMSSRNAYLDTDQRAAATCLQRALRVVREQVGRMELTATQAIQLGREVIEATPGTRIDYIEVRHALTLEPLDVIKKGQTVMALAVFVGYTRLIDNTKL
jgi:pantoate--beta-alanine ligase